MIHVIVGGLIEKDGKFLLVQEAKKRAYKKWNIPAGHLEENETLFEAAKREVFEETGCEVEIGNMLHIINTINDDYTNIIITFKTDLINENISYNPDEIIDVKWLTYEEILNMQEELRNKDLILNTINAYKAGREVDKSTISIVKTKTIIQEFGSINETYNWLKEKQKDLNEKQRIINFYYEKTYNDSYNEINYLTEKIESIKNGKPIEDMFILTENELKELSNNYFFNTLKNLNNENYKMIFINKDEIIKKDPQIYKEITDGIIIYEDCVYKDHYNIEYSLGYVMKDKQNIKKYNELFEQILEKYSK